MARGFQDPIGNRFADDEGFSPPKSGGSEAVKYALINSTMSFVAARELFTIYPGEWITELRVITKVAWDGTDSNTMDIGIDGDGDSLADGISMAAVGVLLPAGEAVVEWMKTRQVPTVVTAQYLGTSPAVGQSIIMARYIRVKL